MLTKLFEPIKIGPITLRNRVVMTAVHLNYTPGGEVSDQLVNFYKARSEGGAGLLILGGAEIDDEASGIDLMVSIKDDKFISGLKRFTDAVHEGGAKVAVQLYQAGAYSFCSFKGLPILAPSEITSYFTRTTTKAMTLEDIKRIQDDFVKAAKRAQVAGFDAVETLASAGYLICQFLSPKTNKRTDEYGGSLENRMRFGLEVIRMISDAISPNMAQIVRIAGNDFVPGSNTNTEAAIFAAAAQDAGAHCINVTGGWHESRIPQITMDLPQGGYAYLARGIKQAVDVPVIACNRINDPFVAEEILQEGIADLVGVCRGLIADPEFVKKSAENRTAEIRRCVACNQKCFDHVFQLLPVGCMVNPRAGREAETDISPAPEPKKLLVAGAGPAGCEFALTAAMRGHQVILCEKENHIGGQVVWFQKPTRKHDFHYMFDYYQTALPKVGVELRLGVEVTPELVESEKPDAVIVATGAAPFKPPIEAIEQDHVHQAWDILKDKVNVGHNVVVVGGGSVGLETAIHVASKGAISPEQLHFLMMHEAETPETLRQLILRGNKKVTVIEMLRRVGQDVGQSTRWVLLKEVQMRGIEVITEATMKDIKPGKITYTNSKGEDIELPADTVVLAMGARPENSLAKRLGGLGVEVKIIGDAGKVGRISSAIEQGFDLARAV